MKRGAALFLKKAKQDTILKRENHLKKSVKTKMHILTKMSGKIVLKIQTISFSTHSNQTTELNGSMISAGILKWRWLTRTFLEIKSSERISARSLTQLKRERM